MKKNKIGISTAVDTNKDNWDRMLDLINSGFTYIELYNKITRIRFVDINPLKKIAKEKKLTFSFHSMVQDIFCEDPDIANQEYYTLKGEIKIASLIGCSRLIFHINKKVELSEEEINSLNELTNYANNLGVTLTQENNQSGPMSGEYLAILGEKIPKLRFCLDIGHLNLAFNKGTVTDRGSFIKKIAKKLVEVHLHYNDGKKDEHKEIDYSSIDYLRQIIYTISKNNLDYVIETKNLEQAKILLDILINKLL